MQCISPTCWPLLIFLIPIYLLYTLIMTHMLIDTAIIHAALHRKRPVRVPQPAILPPELWNAILAQCPDRFTLLTCSLVGSAWASINREHLHLEVSLDARTRTAHLNHLLRSRLQTLTHTAYCVSCSGQDYGQHWRGVRLLHLRGSQLRTAILTGDARAVPLLVRYFPDIVNLTFECNASSAVLSNQVIPAEELSKLLSFLKAFVPCPSTLTTSGTRRLTMANPLTPLPLSDYPCTEDGLASLGATQDFGAPCA